MKQVNKFMSLLVLMLSFNQLSYAHTISEYSNIQPHSTHTHSSLSSNDGQIKLNALPRTSHTSYTMTKGHQFKSSYVYISLSDIAQMVSTRQYVVMTPQNNYFAAATRSSARAHTRSYWP
jgi:hypothetical protein